MRKIIFLIYTLSFITFAGEFKVPDHSNFVVDKVYPLNGDFDGDGTNDLMVCDNNGNNHAVYSYSKKEYLVDFLNISSFSYTTSDLDNNGSIELIVESYQTGYVIYSYAGGTSSRKK